MGYKNNKRKLILGGIFLILIVISIGYAFLTQNLKINGRTGIKENSWNIYFNDVDERCYSMNASTPAYIVEDNKTRINFEVGLAKPGQVYSFDAEIKNDGTIDAMIDEVTLAGIPEELKDIITWNVEYLYGEKLQKCDELLHNTTRKIRVTLEYKKDIDALPDEQDLNLSLEIKYVQLDGNECTLIPAESDPVEDAMCGERILTVDPNGGVYNETESNTLIPLQPNGEYEMLTPTREGYKFLGWTANKENVYDQDTNKVTMGYENITMTANWEEKYTLTINPNGGIYGKDTEEETTEVIVKEMLENETYTLLDFTREGYELVLDLSNIDEYNSTNSTITMGTKSIKITAEWNIIDTSDVIARRGSKYYGTIQEAFDDEVTQNYKVELLEEKCSNGNTITESPTNNNTHALSFDMHGCKVTGTLTNNKNLTLYNGTFENLEGIGGINTGTLTLGINDGTVLVDEEGTVALIGSSTEGIGLQNTGTFNFYDGYLEAKVGLTGGYDDIPEEWYVYVNHNDVKNCQKVHLTQDVSRAVAKTVYEGVDTRYFNLQDAFNSGMIEDLDVYAIRDFEAPYELHIDENEELLFDLSGWTVRPGNTTTNNGTFTITDTKRTTTEDGEEITVTGELMPSKTITNNEILNITNAKITETTDANVITNSGTINLNDSIITSPSSYIIYNINNGIIGGNTLSSLNTSNYAVYNSGNNAIVKAMIKTTSNKFIYNIGKIKIIENAYLEINTNTDTLYGIYNKDGEVTINGGTIKLTNSQNNGTAWGVRQEGSAITNIQSGTIEIKSPHAYGIRGYYGSGSYNPVYHCTINMSGGNVNLEATNGEAEGLAGGIVTLSEGSIDVKATGTSAGIVVEDYYNISGGELKVISSNTSNKTAAIAIRQSMGGESTIDNVTVNSSHECIAKYHRYYSTISSKVKINNGTFNCGTYGITTTSPIEINNGTFNTNDYGIKTSYNYIYMNNGVINSSNSYGIYNVNSITIRIGNSSAEAIPTITGTTGIYTTSGTTTIAKANIIGTTEYGVYAKNVINIGTDDNNISIESPSIRGNLYGIYEDNTEINFYDGILKGQTAGYYENIAGLADGAEIANGTETIKTELYKTNYLKEYIKFVQVGTETFSSLNEALAAIDSEGTMKIIMDAEVKYEVEVPSTKNVILDLNGKELELYKKIVNKGTLTIDDTSEEQNGTMNCYVSNCLDNRGTTTITTSEINNTEVTINNTGTLELKENAKINVIGNEDNLYGINNKKNIIINGASLTIENQKSNSVSYGINQSDSASTTINSGMLKVKAPNAYGIRGYYGSGSYNPNYHCDLYMNGGIINVQATTGSAEGFGGAIAQITDGTIIVSGPGYVRGIVSQGKIEINDGEINVTSTNTNDQSAAIGIVQSMGSESTIHNVRLTSSHQCLSTYNTYYSSGPKLTINGGNYNCGTYGMNASSPVEINGGIMVAGLYGIKNTQSLVFNDGELTANKGYGISMTNNLTVLGGKIISKTENGIYYNSLSTLTIGSLTNDKTPYIEGQTNGIYINQGSATIAKAKIIGNTNMGIHTKGTTTIGTNDETVSITMPEIIGLEEGLHIESGVTNFYDGIVKGQTAGYSGFISGFPDAYSITDGTENISGNNYKTNYLAANSNFVKVGETEYNSLNKAIAAIEETGTMELIGSATIKSKVTVPSGKNITLNLAKFSLSLSKEIENNGTFTILDNSTEKTGGISCTITRCLTNNGDLTISGGTYTSNKSIYNTNVLTIADGAKIEIAENINDSVIGIYNVDNATTNITGGIIKVENDYTNGGTTYAVYQQSATTNINGGLLEVTSNHNAYAVGNNYQYGSVSLAGGTINIKAQNEGFGILSNQVVMSNGSIHLECNTGKAITSEGYNGLLNITGGTIDFIANANNNSTAINRYYGGIIENVTINSSFNCVNYHGSAGEFIINSGNYTCGTIGIYKEANGSLIINGGTINSKSYGVHNYKGNTIIKGGTITSSNSYGVYTQGTSLTIGSKDNDVSITNPSIRGDSYGVYIDNGTVSFYDGILKGQTGAYYGHLTNIEDNAMIKDDNETIEEQEYKTKYLLTQTIFVKNNSKNEDNTYSNLQTAIDEANSGDELELIASADIYYPITIPSDKTISLDMKGYSLKTSKTITNNGTLNLSDTSSEKTSNITCYLSINLFINNGTLSIHTVDINYSSTNSSYYPLTNNSITTLTNVDISLGYYGIRNNENSKLTLNNSNISATNTAIYNFGDLHITDGVINGTSYGIYNQTSIDNDITEATITSDNTAIYKYNKSSKTTITDSNILIGQIQNNIGTVSITGGNITGNIDNKDQMTIDGTEFNKEFSSTSTTIQINNTSSLSITNTKINNTITNYAPHRVVYSTGTLDISNNEIKVYRTAYSNNSNALSTIYNYGGTVTSTGNNIYMEENTDTAISNKQVRLRAVANENGGSFASNNDVISLKNGGTSYGVYNDSSNSINTISNLQIESIGSNTSYGIYNNSGSITMNQGTIDISSVSAYGIYLNSASAKVTLGIKDGSGLKTADMSTTNPLIKAIGTTQGIGVKNNSGYFYFYDGKLIGNTYAKPETAQEVETGFESRYFLVHSDETVTEVPFGGESGKTYEYEYCILEYMQD